MSYADDIFSEPTLLLNSGSGWSSSDNKKYNEDMNELLSKVDVKMSDFDKKVNTALQSINAQGELYTYTYWMGCGATCDEDHGCNCDSYVYDLKKTVTCPAGKTPNYIAHTQTFSCSRRGMCGGYDLKTGCDPRYRDCNRRTYYTDNGCK